MVLRYGVTNLSSLDRFPQLHVRGVLSQHNPALSSQIDHLEKQKKSLVQQSRNEKLNDLQRQQLKTQIAQVKQELQPLKEQLKEKEAELIRQANVVGCTLSKAAIAQEIHQRRFDAVVIDEASMAYIPHCAFISTLARRRVAVFGDFRQLGPISQADTEATREWLQQDIFNEAGITASVKRGCTDPILVLLKIQYRMHPDIAAIPNRLFYDSQLVDGAGVKEQTTSIAQNLPSFGNALVLYDLTKWSAFCFSEEESHSRFNFISALIAVNLAYASVQAGNSNIGIITPYNAQSRLIHRLLNDLSIAQKQVKVVTVHRFQRSEQDVIIFDTVEGPPREKPDY
ncbi:AAA domain-containing protein [Gloeocapsa sp. BRSZ]